MYEQLVAFIQQKISVSQAALDTILSYFKPMTIAKNEMLHINGQTGRRLYFVGKGCLRIYFINEVGQEATRHFSFENQFATAMMHFMTGIDAGEYIQAAERTTLLYISHEDFYHLLATIPQWEKFYRHYLEFANVINTRRLMSFLTQDATEKYKQLLADNPTVVQRLPNKLVASYLHISQETLSRLKSKL
ncbi:CRP-like cAMP-binding protein [Chitinophaga skermanii]|uniref:CRP-like cAMP-binding protein n=2 Tax=Chitinophaga skermanii TaxID=331697 RepID=A0A327Q7Z0_9BACT|nr:CRP-like cAMP-binding protein [Chitinophaga skermanii]